MTDVFQLTNTKANFQPEFFRSSGLTRYLSHVLVELIETKQPDALRFWDELTQVDGAARGMKMYSPLFAVLLIHGFMGKLFRELKSFCLILRAIFRVHSFKERHRRCAEDHRNITERPGKASYRCESQSIE